MSPHLPVLSGQRMLAVLTLIGFVQVSQRGSHVKVRHPDGRIAILPMHKELAPGTLRSILRQAGLSVDDLRKLVDQ
ncbi:MAG: type II toxin-antitoxin system HicA family toxin [Alicyclobacillus sp.]|nr:type II toxin-antitoxin system HicA family toxin [Alicyclobacillus sp.]